MYSEKNKLKIRMYSVFYNENIKSFDFMQNGTHSLTLDELQDSIIDSIKYHFENIKDEMSNNKYTHEWGIATMPFMHFPYKETLNDDAKNQIKRLENEYELKNKHKKKEIKYEDFNEKPNKKPRQRRKK